MKADQVIYGNIITMDEKQPKAQAVAVKDGRIMFVGTKDAASEFVGPETKVIDFATSTVYPGMIDVHSHMGLLTTTMVGGPTLPYGDSYEKNVQDITKFIKENPDYEFYKAYGFSFDAKRGFPTHELLDAIEIDGKKVDKPIYVVDAGGHLGWMNKVAMKKFGVDKTMVEKYGEDAVPCEKNGELAGCVKETPHFTILASIPVPLKDIEYVFAEMQKIYLSHGYCMIGDCGINEGAIPMVTAMGDLAQQGKFKLQIRAYYQIFESGSDPLKEVERAAEFAKKYNSDTFKIVGIKIFLDGVNEGMSSWTLTPYKNYQFKGQPYSGYKRWNYDRIDELAELVKKANQNGLSMELHAIGSGAVRYALDVLEKAQAGVEHPDFRNAISHITMIDEADVPRFAKLNVTPVTAPQWAVFDPQAINAEKLIYGDPEYLEMGKFKSFLDTGANLVFHSDGNPIFEVGRMFFTAVNKYDPVLDSNMPPRNLKERISGYEAVKSMTKRAAYVLREENNLGTIEPGKQADFAVFDADFTDDDAMKDPKICELKPKALFIKGEQLF